MSPTARPPELPGGLIPVPVPKALLLLTVEEYARALARGKAYRRAEALTRRVAVESKHSTITVAP